MTTNVLDISNVINITITDTPSGLISKNVNSLLLLTQDPASNAETFGNYVGAAAVASNYGTNSVTTQMANNIFAQLPNLLSGDGGLIIAPMLAAVSATAGHATTANISANLSAIIAVNNGDIGITINGVTYNLGNLNFTACVTWSDVAAVIQAALVNGTVAATSNGISVTSKKVGSTSTVALVAYASTGTDLSGAGYFNVGSETAVAGANSSGETVLQAINRLAPLVSFVPVITTLNIEDAVIESTASAIQAMDNMFLHHIASTQDIAGIATTVSAAGQTKTRLILYTGGQAAANLAKAAYAGRGFSVDFAGSNTSQTMNLKQLVNVTPDTGISQTNYDAAQIAGCDMYVSYGGVPSVVSTGGNDFFDNPYSDLAAKFALQVAGFNYLRQTNTKVPQTEPGMDGLKDAYSQVGQQFVTNGCWAPGTWNSSETFGDPVTFNNNISTTGYYIYSQPIAKQNATDRQNRKAPLCQMAAKRAGAIQESDVLVVINA